MLKVPDKTIAFIPTVSNNGVKEFDMNISSFLKPLNENYKRDWFTSNFYKCLPLVIGNTQGFAFSCPYTFDVFWNGGNHPEDLMINVHDDSDFDIKNMNHVTVGSHFGSGIFTLLMPVILKTPEGVNLMTIAPPNYIISAVTPMTGVIECDNLRFTFTLNFKINTPNVLIKITKNSPIMGIIPIPRYYCDSFNLINGYEIFDKIDVDSERKIANDHSKSRDYQNLHNLGAERSYYKGMDFYKNKFKDHQLPKQKK